MNEHETFTYMCAHKHAWTQTRIQTHTHSLLDMARWCNPLVFPVFHIFPLLCWDYAVVQSDFGPLSSDDV